MNTVYILQMDTLIQNGQATEGAIALIKKLEYEQTPYAIVTEQSGRIRDHFADYFAERGFRYVRPASFYTSSMAAVDYLVRRYPERKKAMMIGGDGLKEVIEKGNLKITSDQPDYVFVGADKKADYDVYSDALNALINGANLILTDLRKTMKSDGEHMIGCASVAHMLSYASGKKILSFGRGSENFYHMTSIFLKRKPEDIIVVGNDFARDILPAIKIGMTTVFVTEGKSIEKLGMSEKIHPDYIVENLSGLTK